MKEVPVRVDPAYTVCIERGLLKKAGRILAARYPEQKTVIVTDQTVDRLWGDVLRQSLTEAGISHATFAFKGGEGCKNLHTLEELLLFLQEQGITRSDYLIALGGGIVGDMTGFASSVWLRGVDFVQLPTTLLAAVDSSVGGKTGVNLAGIKNQVGTFHQPSLVLCDPDVFSTLPEEIFADGMAEVIKYGFIFDPAFLARLAEKADEQIEDTVAACIAYKASVVEVDAHDNGRRQLLNFGHTVAHAIEAKSNGEISHGRAVAMGMVIAAEAAEKSKFCQDAILPTLKMLLTKYHLPIHCPFSVSALIPYMENDKKRSGDRITLILPAALGSCELYPTTLSALAELFYDKGGSDS